MQVSPRLRVLIAAAVFVVALCLYVKTLAPTVGPVDSGELTVAAWCLGNAHPPGFPLYLLTTHVLMQLPLKSVAWRANLASAIYAAGAAAVMALVISEALLAPPMPAKKEDRRRKRKEASIPDAPMTATTVATLMLFGGLTLAVSRTLWGYATVAEVYTLNTLLLLLILYLMLVWRRRKEILWLYAAAALFGAALGVHHVTIGLGLAAYGILVWRTAGSDFFRSRRLAIAALLATAMAIMIYAYLPIAASRNPVMNWGDPRTLSRVIDHITAKQYRSFLQTAKAGVLLDEVRDRTWREFGLPLTLLLAAIGIASCFRRDRTMLWFLVAFTGIDLAWVMNFPVQNDRDAYLLPAFVATTIAAACGGGWLIARARGTGQQRLAAVSLLLLPVIAAVIVWPYRNRGRFWVTEDYVQNALDAMRPNSVLITGEWELYAPMRYFLDVEHRRPDVTAIHARMLPRPWYVDMLEARSPAVMQAVRGEIAQFRPLIERLAREPDSIDEPGEHEAYFRSLENLTMALFRTTTARGGGFYATPDFFTGGVENYENVVQALGRQNELVPRGVVIEYLPGHGRREVDTTPLRMRGLADGSIRYEPDDVVVTEIIPAYRNGLLMRARTLAMMRRLPEAIADYQRARELAPNDAMIQSELLAVLAHRDRKQE